MCYNLRMEGKAILGHSATLGARVYRAHPKPEGMTDDEYKTLLAAHSEQVGHWQDLGIIAKTEDDTLRVGQGGL